MKPNNRKNQSSKPETLRINDVIFHITWDDVWSEGARIEIVELPHAFCPEAAEEIADAFRNAARLAREGEVEA